MKNKITRKEFISKTGKSLCGLACAPTLMVIAQSCVNPVSPADSNFIATCSSGHGGQFNQDGDVVAGPPSSALTKYSTTFDDAFITIEGIEGETINIPFSDHPNLLDVGGVSSTDEIDIDWQGVLLFRKSETEIVALSRQCPHAFERINPFEEI